MLCSIVCLLPLQLPPASHSNVKRRLIEKFKKSLFHYGSDPYNLKAELSKVCTVKLICSYAYNQTYGHRFRKIIYINLTVLINLYYKSDSCSPVVILQVRTFSKAKTNLIIVSLNINTKSLSSFPAASPGLSRADGIRINQLRLVASEPPLHSRPPRQ